LYLNPEKIKNLFLVDRARKDMMANVKKKKTQLKTII
jgi:hypothetical protein